MSRSSPSAQRGNVIIRTDLRMLTFEDLEVEFQNTPLRAVNGCVRPPLGYRTLHPTPRTPQRDGPVVSPAENTE